MLNIQIVAVRIEQPEVIEAVRTIIWFLYGSGITPSNETSVDGSSEEAGAYSTRKSAATFEAFGAAIAGWSGGCFGFSLFCRRDALLDLVLSVRTSRIQARATRDDLAVNQQKVQCIEDILPRITSCYLRLCLMTCHWSSTFWFN